MANLLKYVVVPASTRHTATVIFLHGLGDTGHGWEPVANVLKASAPHIKWVLPHAPIRPITLNYGMKMPAWFDIAKLSPGATEDEHGMLQTIGQVNELVKDEIKGGIPPSRIVIGGFSQGGVTGLLTGLTSESRLAGIMCLSGWVGMKNRLKDMARPHASATPIFWGHGTADPLVVYNELAMPSIKFLKNTMGVKDATSQDPVGLDLHLYEGLGHSSCPQEITDMRNWLARVLPF